MNISTLGFHTTNDLLCLMILGLSHWLRNRKTTQSFSQTFIAEVINFLSRNEQLFEMTSLDRAELPVLKWLNCNFMSSNHIADTVASKWTLWLICYCFKIAAKMSKLAENVLVNQEDISQDKRYINTEEIRHSTLPPAGTERHLLSHRHRMLYEDADTVSAT